MNLGRVGLTLLIEAAMQAWHQQGRPPHLLNAAMEHFQAARHYWSTAGFAPRSVIPAANRLFSSNLSERGPLTLLLSKYGLHGCLPRRRPCGCRAPEGSQLDLHTLSPWSAQLLLLDFLRTISARIDAGWQFPRCDLTIVTGKGSHTKAESAREGCSVRDVTLRFLQVSLPQIMLATNLEPTM